MAYLKKNFKSLGISLGMHDLPVSTADGRNETSLDVAQLQFIAHQPRDGRTGSYTGRKKGAIPTARKQHWSRKASRARPIGSSLSGRWESNPPLTLYKLLNILASLPLSASNCVQLQGI